MKRILTGIISLILFTSCADQKLFKPFSKTEKITEISISEYLPIYSSQSALLIKQIVESENIEELVNIVNRAKEIDSKYVFVLSSNPTPSFNFMIRFGNNEFTLNLIYVLFYKTDIYVTSLAMYKENIQNRVLYQIQESDLVRFKYLLLNN
jgi:hypothetical protein